MRLLCTILILLCPPALSAGPFWGVADSGLDPARARREAPLWVARGANCVLLDARGLDPAWESLAKAQEAWTAAGAVCFWSLPAHPPIQPPRFLPLARQKSTAGFRIAAPEGMPAAQDEAASWQRFLKTFFGDASPADDTSGDTATFNAAFTASHTAWDQAQPFTGQELSDPAKRRLADMWRADEHSRRVASACQSLYNINRAAPAGPAITSVSTGAEDASLLASRRAVGRLYAGAAQAVPAIESAAAAFGRKVVAAPVSLVPGDYAASLRRAMGLLPYVEGIIFDLGTDRSDPALRVIPELAPFAGRLRVPRANVLWIVSPGAETAGILDAYCVSESALAIDPNCLDLTRFTAVIYRASAPSASTAILQKLFERALGGGTVFVEAYRAGSGPTLHGRDSSPYWWEFAKLDRADFGQGSTEVAYAGRKWSIPLTAPYFSGDQSRLHPRGEVTDSTGAKYPLLFVRKLGTAGKWVMLNVPDLWDAQFSLLAAIVREQSGIDLPDPSKTRVYRGEQCALVIGGQEKAEVRIDCPYHEVVLFDVAAREAHLARAQNGQVRLPGEVGPGEGRLWVVKPYGKPIVLYTGGAPDHAASLLDGDCSSGALRFRFTAQAFISSPARPASLTIDGRPEPFDYDPTRRLVTIRRSGDTVEARLEYARQAAPK